MPAGLKQASKLPEPIFTPVDQGRHRPRREYRYEANAREFSEMKSLNGVKELESGNLFAPAAITRRNTGSFVPTRNSNLGLVDGKLLLIDECLTPDSSRFWPADQYAVGQSPPSFDKQFVRDYLETLDWNKTPPGPTLPGEVIAKTSAKYIEAFEKLTGEKLK